MEEEDGGDKVLDECDCCLFVEDEVGEEEEGGDGESHVGVDNALSGPELASEDLRGGVSTWERWKWKEKLMRHTTTIRVSS